MVAPGMAETLAQPLAIFVLALGAGFLLPLFHRLGQRPAVGVFLLVLSALVLIPAWQLPILLDGAPPVEILTAGFQPPFAINLRLGLVEAFFILSVNGVSLLAAWQLLPLLRERASTLLLFLILVMGINGQILTRDLFNLFIFMEISAIAAYALIAMERSLGALAAGFKYVIATSLATVFLLLGIIFLYHLTGTLNIDDLIANRALIAGPLGLIASLFLLTSLLIELKPYPANGWGLDVYQTAPTGIASMISVGISAGVFFALLKLMPLMENYLGSIALVGGLTFLASNLIGLKQTHARRLLGYSSIGQMGLLTLALALGWRLGLRDSLPLIIGGLFLNHLLAKAGLFWLAGMLGKDSIGDWAVLARRPLLLVVFGALLAALVGLPPFPGFWAKWALVMELGAGGLHGWILLVLVGSLLEAAYLFRWFGQAREGAGDESVRICLGQSAPLLLAAVALLVSGVIAGELMGAGGPALVLPLGAALVLWLLDDLSARFKGLVMLVLVALVGHWMTESLMGLRGLFAMLLLGGGLLVSLAGLVRADTRRGFYPLLTLLLLSLAALTAASTGLQFFVAWEFMTLSSYLLVTLGREGRKVGLSYLLFSLASAYLVMAGLALAFAASGSFELAALSRVGESRGLVFSLLAIGFLIKLGGLGLHVWLPAAYGEADDDVSALLSAVVSKAAIFGLVLVGGQLGLTAGIGLDPAYALGWIGMLTATFGAMMAAFQEDLKRMLAYSSMGQLGYIVAGIALMNHLGWVAALFITVNHLLFKGILFLAAAGVILRTGQREMYRMGGLIRNMPLTFALVLVAIIAMSGVPPLSGYAGKWLLFNAMMEQGWYWLAALGFFSSALAFLYMYRLLHTVFLGQRKLEHHDLREAPAILLLPQVLMAVLILVISSYPRLLLDPLSLFIGELSPHLAGQLMWNGLTLHTHLGYWNPTLVMAVIAGVFLVPLLLLWLATRTLTMQKVEQFNIVYAAERPERPETTHYAWNFYAHYQRVVGFLVQPRAIAFWGALGEWSHSAASSLRIFYNGNGQTYALLVLIYFVAMVAVNGGLVP